MRFRWFKDLSPFVQLLTLSGLIFIIVISYIPLAKYIRPAITSLLSRPLKFCQVVSSNASQFLRFQNLVEENKGLRSRINQLTGQLVQLQEAAEENQRLRDLLSLPQQKSLRTTTALVVGKDSSNWTRTILINRGRLSGVRKGMPVVLGRSLVGRIVEAATNVSKVVLITDFNSKIPAKILRTREEGVVVGEFSGGRSSCKIKYMQKVEIGDEVISSGLGEIYPKGLLLGEVIAVAEEQENKLYKVAEIEPAVDFSTLEEVMVITGQ